ncbi:MAG: phosphatase domain-containing protein, partial [Aestuariivirgaceae bacterium]
LQPFIALHYPTGSIAMRHFRLKDSSLVDFLFKPSFDFKLAAITSIIKRFPGHRFILIGDSGECDPEIYGEIYRKHPGKIEQIMIRKVTGSDFGNGRMARAFSQVPGETWALLKGAATVGDSVCRHG